MVFYVHCSYRPSMDRERCWIFQEAKCIRVNASLQDAARTRQLAGNPLTRSLHPLSVERCTPPAVWHSLYSRWTSATTTKRNKYCGSLEDYTAWYQWHVAIGCRPGYIDKAQRHLPSRYLDDIFKWNSQKKSQLLLSFDNCSKIHSGVVKRSKD